MVFATTSTITKYLLQYLLLAVIACSLIISGTSIPSSLNSLTLPQFHAHILAHTPPTPPSLDFKALATNFLTKDASCAPEILRCYQLHCDTCRDYFLTAVQAHETPSNSDIQTAIEDMKSWTGAAIPQCAVIESGDVESGDEYEEIRLRSLEGLVRDLRAFAELYESEEDAHGDDAHGDDEWLSSASARRVRVFKKVLSKAVMIGMNYAQGRLALAALRMKAEERDLAVPKFPLAGF